MASLYDDNRYSRDANQYELPGRSLNLIGSSQAYKLDRAADNAFRQRGFNPDNSVSEKAWDQQRGTGKFAKASRGGSNG